MGTFFHSSETKLTSIVEQYSALTALLMMQSAIENMLSLMEQMRFGQCALGANATPAQCGLIKQAGLTYRDRSEVFFVMVAIDVLR